MGTYYVDPASAGGDGTTGALSGANAAFTKFSDCFGTNPAGGPHIVYAPVGAYPGDYINIGASQGNWADATIIATVASGSTTPATSGVILLTPPANKNGVWCNRNFTMHRIAVTGVSSNFYEGIGIYGGAFNGYKLKAYDNPGPNFKAYNTAAAVNLYNCDFYGSQYTYGVWLQGATGGVNMYFSLVRRSTVNDSGTTGAVYLSASSVFNPYNCFIGGPVSHGITISSGTLGGANDVVEGGRINTSGTAYSVYNVGGTNNLSNSMIIVPWFSQVGFYGTVGGTGNVFTSNPRFVRRQRSGFLIPCVDDNGNNAWAKTFAGILHGRGLKGTYYLNAYGLSAYTTALADIAATYPGTMEWGFHSNAHTDLSIADDSNLWTIAGATVEVDRTGTGTITVTGTPGGTITGFKTKTLGEIATALTAAGCTLTNSSYAPNDSTQGKVGISVLGECLKTAAGGSAAIKLLVDATAATGYLKTEIVDGLASFLATLTAAGILPTQSGYTMATPYHQSNATVNAAVAAAGLWSLRNLGEGAASTATLMLASVDTMDLPDVISDIITGNHVVSGAADNGVGLVRITTSLAHYFYTGDVVTISGVTGTTEANGTWTVTVYDSTHFDLVGSTFAHVYSANGTTACLGATRRAAHALCAMLAEHGGIMYILGHNAAQISADDWGVILDVAKEYSEISVMSAYDAVNTIKNTPAVWSTADLGRTYTRTWTDRSNYRPNQASKLIGAGSNAALTGIASLTDMAGFPITDGSGAVKVPGGTVDIGPYQHAQHQPQNAIGMGM
jgi:hypothetical protein